MRKLWFILLVILFTSCQTTIKSPVTQIEYTGSIGRSGVTILAKPPMWDSLCNFYDYIFSSKEDQTQSPQ